jgi:hypothetical protein
MKTLRRLLGLLAAGASACAAAAAGPGFLPPWRDAQGPRLELHDPTGLRALVESSGDLRQWTLDRAVYLPAFTDTLLRPQAWLPPADPPAAFRAYRVRRMREGRVLFGNRVTAIGINAPVTFLGDRPGAPVGPPSLASGAYFSAQLLVAVPGLYEGPVGKPVPFRTGGFAGYISASDVTVPMSDASNVINVWMVAWVADLGSSYYEALSKGVGNTGISQVISVRPATGQDPSTPLVGLAPFTITVPAGSPP